MPLPFTLIIYLNSDKIQSLYEETNLKSIYNKKITVKLNSEASARPGLTSKPFIEGEVGGSGKLGRERIEEYNITMAPRQKLRAVESFIAHQNIIIYNLNVEKRFFNYINNFVFFIANFKGNHSGEVIDLNGSLDEYSVHISASKKYFTSPTWSVRFSQSQVPLSLNVFGVLRGIDTTAKIMEIDPIAL